MFIKFVLNLLKFYVFPVHCVNDINYMPRGSFAQNWHQTISRTLRSLHGVITSDIFNSCGTAAEVMKSPGESPR